MKLASVLQDMVALTTTMVLTTTASVMECLKSVQGETEVEEEEWEVMAMVEQMQARAFIADTLCT